MLLTIITPFCNKGSCQSIYSKYLKLFFRLPYLTYRECNYYARYLIFSNWWIDSNGQQHRNKKLPILFHIRKFEDKVISSIRLNFTKTLFHPYLQTTPFEAIYAWNSPTLVGHVIHLFCQWINHYIKWTKFYHY